ncbi:hypothetical protein [Streptomyces sp. NPDC058108]|uniref:hypothetical protein n=1 Tax=Streptomyces sp. NPDC058108 TaxID=3346344 RepID=UPI0036E1183D
MAGSFRIAEGYVEVTADESGYDRAMDRLKSRKNQVDVKLGLIDGEARTALDRFLRERFLKVRINLDDTALSRLKLKDLTVNIVPKISDAAEQAVRTKLDRLTADRVVNIRASVDTRVGANELANLTRRRTVRIGTDVDTRAGADDLALLTRPRTTRITADADTAAARARLDLLARDRTVHLRANMSGFAGIGGGGGGGGGGIVGWFTNLIKLGAKWGAIAGSVLPSVVSLGQSIAAMGPAAAVAVPAVLSLGAAFAAIKIGTSGVGDAFKAAFAPATSSASAAESSTRRVEAAQRSLAKAQQGVKDAEQRAAEARVQAARQIEDAQRSLKSTVQDVADANRRAADQVEQAERDLADAQRDARKAQQDLTASRKEAAQELEDLNARLADAELDQRQAVLDLQDAEQNLAAVKAKGAAASKEDLDKAQLQYDKAKQGLSEQQTETARLQQQTTDANAAGVEGSKTVTDAKQKISDANTDVADKTKALSDAERDQAQTAQEGLQKVAAAQRDVADAREAARKAAVDGARDIKDAQEAVADAARSMAEAQESGAAATDKAAEALAKLAPNARSFVSAVVAQAGAWRALKLDVQNSLFAGLGQKFTTMSGSILPSLRQGLTGTAGVLNQMAKGAFDAVTNLGKTGTLKQMFSGLNEGLKPLAKIPGQFITGLAQISVAASPAFKRLTTAAGGAATGIAQKLGDAFKSGKLEGAINGAVEVAKQFGHLIGDVFGTLGNVMKAAGSAGGDALGTLGSVFKELRRITAMPEVQKALGEIFKALSEVGKLIAGALGSAIQAALPLLAQLAPFVTMLAKQLGPVIGKLLGELGKALGPIISALLPILGDVGGLILDLVKSLMPLLKPIGQLLGEIIKAVGPIIKLVGDNLKIIVEALVKFLKPVIEALIPAVRIFGDIFAKIAPMFAEIYPALLPLIPPLAQLAVSLLELAMQVITPLLPLIVDLARIFTTVLKVAIGLLVPVISGLIGWITSLADYASKGVHAIVEGFKWLWKTAKQLFTDGKNWVTSTWNGLWNGVRTKWDAFWSGLKSKISGAWSSVKGGVSDLKNGITNTWNSLWNGTRDKMSAIFSTITGKITSFKNGVKTTFSTLRDNLGSIWDGIKSKLATPVKWVIGHVYNNGIRKMWNDIAGKISSKITLPPVPLNFNTGGVVPGGRSNKDTVPAMLAPGERILSNAQVDHLGGHRAIDAMLGMDHPTGTGGNPTSAQERKRHQPAQGFVDGGILGKVTSSIGGAISSAASWTKDVVLGGLKAAAQKALSALVRPLIGRIPTSGIGGLMRGLSNKAVDGMLGWFGKEDKKAVGGPAVQRALSWVKTQAGKPYQWGGNGNPSFDCSGLVSAVESVIRGESPHRRWATGAFGSSAPSGWVRNLNSPFMIGITNAGVGHTAGTLAGTNIESRGGDGIVVGKRARGYNDSLFTSRWGFAPATKYDSGGLLQPGATLAVNKTRKPEAVLTAEEHAAFRDIVSRNGGGGDISLTIESINVSGTFDLTNPREAKRLAKAIVDPMCDEIRKLQDSRRR